MDTKHPPPKVQRFPLLQSFLRKRLDVKGNGKNVRRRYVKMPCWEVRRIGLSMEGVNLDTLEAALKEAGFTITRSGGRISFSHSNYGSGSFQNGRLEVERGEHGIAIKKIYTTAVFKKNGVRLGWKVRTNQKGQTELYRRNYTKR